MVMKPLQLKETQWMFLSNHPHRHNPKTNYGFQ
jgi:hypothetical protein